MALRSAVATEDLGRPLKESISFAGDLRVHGVRLNVRTEVRPDEFSETALRQLKLVIAERQMKIAGLLFSSRHALVDPENLDQRIAAIHRAMPLVRSLCTSEFLIRIGRVPDPDHLGDESAAAPAATIAPDDVGNPFAFVAGRPKSPRRASSAEQYRVLVEVLNELAAAGNHIGCHLQLIVASYDPPRLRRLLADVKSGPVGLVFDPATCLMSGSSPVMVFRELHTGIGYVRARDAIRDVDGAGVEACLGDGGVDWLEMLALFDEASLSSWVCVERSGGDDRAADVASGITQLASHNPGFLNIPVTR